MNEMDFENRIVSTEFSEADTDIENSLRPKELTDYIGQEKAKENLSVYIQAARGRGKPLTMFCCMDLRVLVKQLLQE